MTEPRGICLPPGTEILGRSETPVYADDGVTVIYTAVTLRLRVPVQPLTDDPDDDSDDDGDTPIVRPGDGE